MAFASTAIYKQSQRTLILPLALALSLSSFSPAAHCEYRAFELEIVPMEEGAAPVPNPFRNPTRVITTLDPIQYSQLHPLNPGEGIQYLGSWMCWGSTAHYKPICPRPQNDDLERQPATDEGPEALAP